MHVPGALVPGSSTAAHALLQGFMAAGGAADPGTPTSPGGQAWAHAEPRKIFGMLAPRFGSELSATGSLAAESTLVPH